jgi:glutathione synthase/RimK-type ligase-like ATP-grasp enzyme
MPYYIIGCKGDRMKLSILKRKGSRLTTVKKIIENLQDVRLLKKEDSPRINAEILFRWGASYPIESLFEINTPQMIETTDNKKRTRRILKDNHIPIPKTYFNKNEIHNSNHLHYPIIGRTKYHSQGKGVIISNNIRDINADEHSAYWSEVIDKDREFRIYVFFGKIIGAEEKIPNDYNCIIWNFSIGNAIFRIIKQENYPITVCTLAIQAAEVIGIDFAAVDIISKGDQNYVLELNTSPSCTGARCRAIAKGIEWAKNKIETNHTIPRHLELPNIIRSYRELIHPCLR